MKGSIQGSTMAKQMHAARVTETPPDNDATEPTAEEPSQQPTAG
jgi:hypothetical protein